MTIDNGPRIGAGTPVGVTAAVAGTGRYVATVEAVMGLMNADLSESILVVPDASVTGIAPLLPDARGIICLSGGPTSHLALVSREFGVACVMAATLEHDAENLDGASLEIGREGQISMIG